MAIIDYIGVNDDFSQGLVIDALGEEGEAYAKGVCRILAVQWLIESINGGVGNALGTIKNKIANSKGYLKQIGNAQLSYQEFYSSKDLGSFGSMNKVLKLASNDALGVTATSLQLQKADSATAATKNIWWACKLSSTNPEACIISLQMENSGHCIAAIPANASSDNSAWYVFDPNYGVMTATPPARQLSGIIGDIWKAYTPKYSLTYPLT